MYSSQLLHKKMKWKSHLSAALSTGLWVWVPTSMVSPKAGQKLSSQQGTSCQRQQKQLWILNKEFHHKGSKKWNLLVRASLQECCCEHRAKSNYFYLRRQKKLQGEEAISCSLGLQYPAVRPSNCTEDQQPLHEPQEPTAQPGMDEGYMQETVGTYVIWI